MGIGAGLYNKAGVYRIVNRASGDEYVGSSKNLAMRFSDHVCSMRKGQHANKHLQAAHNIGEENLQFQVLLFCAPELAKYYEQRYLDVNKPAMNRSPSAYSQKGLVMDAGECAKRSERVKKLWTDPVYRKRASDARRGNKFCKGHKCTDAQILNRKRAARISNMKRNYGENWKLEYARRYPEHAGDISG